MIIGDPLDSERGKNVKMKNVGFLVLSLIAIMMAANPRLWADETPSQVQIETKIVEASDNFGHDVGVDWGKNDHEIRDAAQSLDMGAMRGLDSATGEAVQPGSGFGEDVGVSPEALRNLEQEGLSQTLAHPKIVAQNNEQAQVAAGETIPFTEKIPQITPGDPTQELQINPQDFHIRFTPRIASSGTMIMLEVVPKISQNIKATNVPETETRQAQSTVQVAKGGTVVLGGLITTGLTENTDSKVPFLSKVPLLGRLFTSSNAQTNDTELTILVTPKLVQRDG